MAEFRWIKMYVFLMLLLQVTAQTSSFYLYLYIPPVRDGDDVTLPCKNVTKDQDQCNSAYWVFFNSRNTAVVELVKHGRLTAAAKSDDRLSVTANCSLVIKNVTAEDVGRYRCQQHGKPFIRDGQVDMSVVTMIEQGDDGHVTLNCSVLEYERAGPYCSHTVKWLFDGKDFPKDRELMKTQSPCFASVTIPTSHHIYTSGDKLLTCEVTVGDRVQVFPFRLQPSGEDTTTAPTESTISTFQPTDGPDCSVVNYVMVAMRVAEFLLITVITVLLIRARVNQRTPDDTTVSYSVRSRSSIVFRSSRQSGHSGL